MNLSDETFFISYQSLCINKKWTSLTSISDFYDINSSMEYQHLCGACENGTAFYEVSDDFTSKHTVNMTKCRNFALKETDLCKICFVYMCKFTWGYGLCRATDKLNWSVQLLI